ncbi:Cytochrome c-550 [Stanieria cyanosphaera PCC 7437]|uniref:Photosystem II extrinsic protein V n=1 Tax=Stanieria cyanosphaera (strain ATCC 29371 / PCC 7437) TaxID=111780 RepID=K9XY95_STAC7|nr:photosystem II cytochrome c-550 [Stanieria cyanosphaera]AFZ37034.1 Cytochrome c-550 [Stanieria cyanosphaera PCC 7437]
MLKRLFLVAVVTIFFVFQSISSATAVELDDAIRTVRLNEAGDEVTLSLQEVKRGQRIFVDSCSYCHKSGTTKTNPNVGLGLNALANAEPPKDNIEGIVEYLKNPTTYDGETNIYELHPNTTRSDLYPMMRNLTDEDLKAVAGHILIQPKIRGTMWGGGKVYN